MAFTQARAGLARSGAVHAGLYGRSHSITIGGTDRTSITLHGFNLTQTLGSPWQAEFRVATTEPNELDEVILYEGNPDRVLFAGHIMTIDVSIDQELLIWRCAALDYCWLLNRFSRVTGEYVDVSINAIVADILSRFTDGGFNTGTIAHSLGTATVTFDHVLVTDALDRLTRMASDDVYWSIDPWTKQVSMFTSISGNTVTLGDTTKVNQASRTTRGDQVRNRVIARGRGSQSTSRVAAGATTVPLDDVGPFNHAGGKLACFGSVLLDYTGKTTGAGAGSLTGVTGIATDLDSGTAFRVAAQADDAAAQSAMATQLGGGLSGIIAHDIESSSWSEAECIAKAAAQLAAWKDPATEVRFSDPRSPENTFIVPGKEVSATVTSPTTVNGSFRIREVTIESVGPDLTLRHVLASSIPKRRLDDLLNTEPDSES